MRWNGFAGGTSISQSPWANNERLVNFIVERIDGTGTTKTALYPTPGFSRLAPDQVITATGPGRAHFYQGGREFALIDQYFVEISSEGRFTSYGTVTSDSFPGTISGNGEVGDQLFIASGGNGYLFTLSTNTLAAIATLAGIADQGDYLGGYFLALNTTTATVRISDLFDGATWDPTQVIQRSAGSDGWISMKVNEYLYLFGTQTSEVWFNAGTYPIPFELHPSGRLAYGTAAAYSPEIVGTALIWLGQTANGRGMVLRTAGFAIEIVSDFSTHYAFDQMVNVSDAIGDSYEESGHVYYLLTFVGADQTWCYDTSMSVWSERSTFDSDRNVFQASRAIHHVFAFGKHRVLDLRGPRAYDMSQSFGTDIDELPIRRLRRVPVLMNENKRLFFRNIELFMETGLATGYTGQGSAPVVMMRWSDDGGKSWSNEVESSAGLRGEWDTRVEWHGCGAARKRTFEFVFSDPVPWRVMDAYFEAVAGTN